MVSTQTFQVGGMTCEHCVQAVTHEISALAGVTAVEVDLSPTGPSTVTVTLTSEHPLRDEQLLAALDEAGDYQLITA